MSCLESNDRFKSERDKIDFHDEGEADGSLSDETPIAANIDESTFDVISFLEFRSATIDTYPSLNWLGPGVMAVHWFKQYLKKEPFDWVQCSKHKHSSVSSSSDSNGNRERKRRRLTQNSKGNFYFIPGQYLRGLEENNDEINTTRELAIQSVLNSGTPGVHYATSYIGVYNLLRSYGKFAREAQTTSPSTPYKSNIHLVCYNGPPLPQ